MEQTIPSFLDVGPASHFPVGSHRVIQVGAHPVLLIHQEGGYIAFEDYCPHRAGPLSEGTLDANRVTCPWHGAQFDIHTGAPVAGPCRRGLRLRAVRLQGERLEVQSVEAHPGK